MTFLVPRGATILWVPWDASLPTSEIVGTKYILHLTVVFLRWAAWAA